MWRRHQLITAILAGSMALPASALACGASPKANGSGYRPPANARSLPAAGAGPEILHRPLATSPQLENARNWHARPILISGAEAYRDGEFLYQDHLYDDRALTYPDDPGRYASNAADIVEVRIAPLARAMAIRVTFNSMLVPDAAAVTISLGDSAEPRTMPHDAGIASKAKVFVTAHGCSGDAVRAADGAALPGRVAVATDLRRRQMQIEIPYTTFDPRGRIVLVGAAAGLWNAAAGAYLRPDSRRPAFFNVAFHGFGPWKINTWKDESERAALAAGDLSPLRAAVDFNKLAAHVDDESDVPTSGPMNRILVSQFETVQGRGNSAGGDIFGNYACDPPACTYQYSGRLQPYAVYVPAVRRPAAGYGLVLNLHGANSNHNHFENGSTEPPLSVWRMLAEDGHPSIMVLPNARGMTYCYFGMAGADPFEAWADVAAHYRLDPRQALLTGSSMGGYGVYKLGSQFPDLFKAVFANIAPEICSFTEAASVAGVPDGNTNIGATLPSLRNVPVLATSGLNDPLVDVAITNRTLQRFDALGYRYDFWHFTDRSGAGHVEYRQFVRDTYRALNRTADTVARDPRRVGYVVDGLFEDPRYGLNSDHAYWLSGLTLADTSADPPIGTVDATSSAIPARAQRLLDAERAAGTSINGSGPYTRQTRRWQPGAPEPLADSFAMSTKNLSRAELDVRRMRLPEYGAFDGTVSTDVPLQLRLHGSFGGATAVTRDGLPLAVATDGTTATLSLPAGSSRLHVTQPAPIVLPACRTRTVRVRVRAPRGDRIRSVEVFVGGRRVRTVHGRAAGRVIRIRIRGARRTRLTVRATTIAGRHLVRTRSLRGCR